MPAKARLRRDTVHCRMLGRFVSSSSFSALVASVGALACGGGDDAPAPSSTTIVDSGSNGGNDAGQSADAAASKPWHASFVAETEPGRGPALLRFFNDTPEILTYSVWATEYLLVPPYTTTESQGAASSELIADSKLLYHTQENLCYEIKIGAIAGPGALQPGLGYTLHVTKLPEGKQAYALALLEDESTPGPFLALRTHLPTPSSLSAGAKLTIVSEPGGQPPLSFDVFGVLPTNYVIVQTSAVTLSRLEFVDQSKKKYEFSGSIGLSAATASGFTIVVDSQPVEGATAVVLEPVP